MCARLIIIMRLPCAARLLLFWRMLTAVRGDACDPRHFLINNGSWFDKSASPLRAVGGKGAYCGDPYVPSRGGGPYNNWAWGGVPPACTYDTRERCQCETQDYKSLCQCRSSFNSNIEMCYTKAYPCIATCGEGKYVTGCGCVDCRNHASKKCTTVYEEGTGQFWENCEDSSDSQADYDQRMVLFEDTTLFNFLDRKCTHDGFRTGYLCGPGQCQDCPKGHYCIDGRNARATVPQQHVSKRDRQDLLLPLHPRHQERRMPSRRPEHRQHVRSRKGMESAAGTVRRLRALA
jgi:hypothetical protein